MISVIVVVLLIAGVIFYRSTADHITKITPYMGILTSKTSLKQGTHKSTTTSYTLSLGESVIVDEKISNTEGQWLRVSLYIRGNHTYGYVQPSSLKKYQYDASFETKIAVFPETYRQSLRVLHCLYPHWQYQPLETKWDFSAAAKTYQAKSLISSSDAALITSNKILEGKIWRRVNLAATRYFMDPRNGLKAANATMFETMTYNSQETLTSATNMLKNTYMNSIESLSHKSWAQLYLFAAKKYNLSVSNLISRAIQEQAATVKTAGGLGSIGGKATNDKSGKIYYNIFNIGARSGDQDGIDYAKTRGWDTREKSINGGAEYLAKKYIAAGQYSLYLQKFDLNNATLGNHSYMANIQAPYGEAVSMIKGYLNNKSVNVERQLIIPVFKNMPTITKYPSAVSASYNMSVNKDMYTYYSIKDMKVTYQKSQDYTGQAIEPALQITNNGHELRKNIDYVVTYANNKEKGHASIHIQGLNMYLGSLDLVFTIK